MIRKDYFRTESKNCLDLESAIHNHK